MARLCSHSSYTQACWCVKETFLSTHESITIKPKAIVLLKICSRKNAQLQSTLLYAELHGNSSTNLLITFVRIKQRNKCAQKESQEFDCCACRSAAYVCVFNGATCLSIRSLSNYIPCVLDYELRLLFHSHRVTKFIIRTLNVVYRITRKCVWKPTYILTYSIYGR